MSSYYDEIGAAVSDALTYEDELNAHAEFVIFGHSAEHGRKVPSSRVTKIVQVKCDGKGGRTPSFTPEPVKTQTDVIRDLIAAGADTLDEIKARWKRLYRRKAISVKWDETVAPIADRLLRVSR